jgi:sugar/nucleoside kinase (ribokinase family)
MANIFAIGNPVFDTIQTRHVQTDGRVLSGCSTNFCLAMAKMGVRTTLVGNVGPDFKAVFEKDMKKYGIDYIAYNSEQSGGFSLRYYGDKGERELNLLGEAGKIGQFPDQFEKADWVVVAPILGEVDFDYIRRIKDSTPAKIFLDPQGILRHSTEGRIEHTKKDDTEKIVSMCDIVKPNELECKVMTGIDPREDYKTPAQMIKSWGAEIVVITLAEKGSIIYDGEEFFEIPAYQTMEKDPTGAGDTYAAGFMYGVIRGYALPDCGIMGTAVASVMIEHTGPDFPLTKSVALERMKTIASSISV